MTSWWLHNCVLPLMQKLPGAIFQQDNARPHGKDVTRLSLHCYYTSFACPIPRFVSNRAYLESFGTASWASHDFERTREASLQQIWNEMSQNMIQNLYASIRVDPRKCAARAPHEGGRV
ncbi:uncharacterized protein TNCV_1210651 [Trichonephila clavipes]|nr:uncharacterized protein TNCV_1210651 [Trichonephila clavipes]